MSSISFAKFQKSPESPASGFRRTGPYSRVKLRRDKQWRRHCVAQACNRSTSRSTLWINIFTRKFPGSRNLILRFIEMMPVSTTEVLSDENFLPIADAKRTIEKRFGDLIPEPSFRTNGPATYYQIPGREQRIGFIGAMTNLHFCESCNKLRLTCDGKLRPCLGSYLEFDIMKPLRAGASDGELKKFFLNVVERKPEQHDFRDNYQPNRKMIAIGG